MLDIREARKIREMKKSKEITKNSKAIRKTRDATRVSATREIRKTMKIMGMRKIRKTMPTRGFLVRFDTSAQKTISRRNAGMVAYKPIFLRRGFSKA